jgi:hypothetical protein
MLQAYTLIEVYSFSLNLIYNSTYFYVTYVNINNEY